MPMVGAGATHAGKVRTHNEDGLLIEPDLGLFVVADGMGGHKAGEVASALALEAIQAFLVRATQDDDHTWPFGLERTLDSNGNRLRTGVKLANRRVFRESERRDEYTGMGTTIAATLFDGDSAVVCGVGDSRVYLIREAEISRLTQDHTWVETLLAQTPGLDREALANHPMRHVLTSVVGAPGRRGGDGDGASRRGARSIRPLHRWRPRGPSGCPNLGDRRGCGSVGEAAEALVKAAIAADGKDNASAVVVEMSVMTRQSSSSPPPAGPPGGSRGGAQLATPVPAGLIGRYQILDKIGEGGMGSLFLARDPAIDRLVAIKLLRHGLDTEPLRERFAREARAAGRLRHPHIVTIFDVGEHDGDPFIAMEFLAGETLAELIRDGARLSLSRRLKLLEELCDGLGYAHRAGLVHRDIKPANLMVDADGVLKILDFGIVRVSDSGMTQAGVLVGTVNYMSPEQVVGSTVDHRSDIFAVGLVAYELISGRQAFPGTMKDRLAEQDSQRRRRSAVQRGSRYRRGSRGDRRAGAAEGSGGSVSGSGAHAQRPLACAHADRTRGRIGRRGRGRGSGRDRRDRRARDDRAGCSASFVRRRSFIRRSTRSRRGTSGQRSRSQAARLLSIRRIAAPAASSRARRRRYWIAAGFSRAARPRVRLRAFRPRPFRCQGFRLRRGRPRAPLSGLSADM